MRCSSHFFGACVALLGAVAALSGAPALDARTIERVDLEGPERAYVYRSGRTGSLGLAEFDEISRARRILTVVRQGEGEEPQIVRSRSTGNNFLRFETGRSRLLKDRTEIYVSRTMSDEQAYTLSFNLRMPRDGFNNRYFFPGEDDWFIITQVIQLSETSNSPAMSINLRRDGTEFFLDVVGRNEVDRFERLVTLPLNDPESFSFDEWNRVRLTFRMGPEGYAELWTSNGDSPLRRIGARNHRLAFQDESTGYSMKVGLYRGGDVGDLRQAYFIDMDDLELSAP